MQTCPCPRRFDRRARYRDAHGRRRRSRLVQPAVLHVPGRGGAARGRPAL